jgi:hypothetical protein
MKKNIIISSANASVGDFVIDHWLRSLKHSNSLNNCDVAFIDYGLNSHQLERLKKEKVIIIPGEKKYHIVNKRFFDAGTFLKNNSYDQVLFVDSGDVIFQGDISSMMESHKDSFRVGLIGKRILFYKLFIFRHFNEDTKREIWRVIKNKPIINAGVIFAPVNKFISMCDEMFRLITNKNDFGPDQIIVNYHLHKNKNDFVLMDSKYNFMMSTAYAGFRLRKGEFYKLNGEKIIIVHNAGQMDIFRPIYNFGYGPTRNQIKHIMYFLKRNMYYLLEMYKKFSLKRRKKILL